MWSSCLGGEMSRRKKSTKPTSGTAAILTRHYGSTGSPRSRADAVEVLECLSGCEDRYDRVDILIGAAAFVITILVAAFLQLSQEERTMLDASTIAILILLGFLDLLWWLRQ